MQQCLCACTNPICELNQKSVVGFGESTDEAISHFAGLALMREGPQPEEAMRPLAIDLFCGLGGFTDGLLAEGYRVIGYDIEAHDYGTGGYPGELVLQDVLTIHGSQVKDAALMVASPPCQEFSYMSMPWSRAKAIAAEYRSGKRDVKKLTALFDACFRIQREAIEAAGRFIPMVVENVRGAQPWVGKARWAFGSFYLWGDVPALMPIAIPRRKSKTGSWDTARANYTPDKTWDAEVNRNPVYELAALGFKTQGMNWSDRSIKGQDFTRVAARQAEGIKTVGHANQRDGHTHTRHLTNQAESDGVKQHKSGRAWFADPDSISGSTSSKSNARKAASAQIAKIPFILSAWIARVYKPKPFPVPRKPKPNPNEQKTKTDRHAF
jgi:hypothetical protein